MAPNQESQAGRRGSGLIVETAQPVPRSAEIPEGNRRRRIGRSVQGCGGVGRVADWAGSPLTTSYRRAGCLALRRGGDHRCAWTSHLEEIRRGEQEHQERREDVDAYPEDRVRLVDTKCLYPQPTGGIAHCVEGEGTSAAECVPAVEPPHQQGDTKIPDCLVREGGVIQPGPELSRLHVVHLEAPGKRGEPAVHLVVEPVPESSDRLSHRKSGGDSVGEDAQRQT